MGGCAHRQGLHSGASYHDLRLLFLTSCINSWHLVVLESLQLGRYTFLSRGDANVLPLSCAQLLPFDYSLHSRSLVLLDKKARRKVDFIPDYVGYDVGGEVSVQAPCRQQHLSSN
jgi:hypothetical protein